MTYLFGRSIQPAMGNVTNENKGFESISRDLIFDNNLSDRARFVYVYMSAKPDDWDFYVSRMCKELGYSENTLRKYIDELLKTGWLERHEQRRHEDGTLGATQYVIKSSCDVNRPQFHRATNFTVRQNYRDGKFGTQRNIDNKEIKNNKEIYNSSREKDEKPQNEQGGISDFKATFIEQATKMKTDESLQMSLAYLKIKDFDALTNEFYRHILNNVKQDDFIRNGYIRNREWLKRTIHNLDLSKATGCSLGHGEYIKDGRRLYKNRNGKEIEVPMDAPPRRQGTIWYKEQCRWGPDI